MHIYLILAVLCILNTGILSGQGRYQEGYIITNKGDTSKGFINVSGLRQSHAYIKFKEYKDAEEIILGPTEIKGFVYRNMRYLSKILMIDKSPHSEDELLYREINGVGINARAYREATHLSTRKVIPDIDLYEMKIEDKGAEPISNQILDKDTIFARICVTGWADLLYHKDENGKDHFFISNEFYETELVQFRYLDLGRFKESVNTYIQIVQLDIYKSQLLKVFDICPEVEEQIIQSDYEMRDMVDLFEAFNQCVGSDNIYVTDIPKLTVSPMVLINLSSYVTDFSGSRHEILDAAVFKHTPGFSAGMAANFDFNGMPGGASYYTELTYSNMNFKGSSDIFNNENDYTYSDLDFSVHTIQFGNQVRLELSDSGIRPYLAAGFIMGFRLAYDSNARTTTYYYGVERTNDEEAISDIKNFALGYMGGVGTCLGRFSVELRYLYQDGLSPFIALRSNISSFNLVLSYRFLD